MIKYSKTPPNPFTVTKLNKLRNERSAVELEIKKAIQDERLRDEDNAINKIKINPKAFYSFAKKVGTVLSSVGPLEDENGILQSDPQIMGNILQKI